MSRTLRWVVTLLPCAPGLTLLAGGLVAFALARDPDAERRAQELALAGGAVVVAGLVVGACVAWRIAHPRPEETEDDEKQPPTG